MTTEQFEVQLATPEREYVKVYKDFLNSTLLSAEEKMIYIALKSFVTYGQDSGKVFPSMDTLCKLTSLSRPRATRTITSLEKKGIVKKTRRGLTKSNLYTLVDIPSMWGASTEEEMRELADTKIPLTDEELLAELERRGTIKIIKEKEPDTTEPTKDQLNQALNKPFVIVNTTTNTSKSQEVERYSLEQIKQIFEYEAMVHDAPERQDDIDSIMSILHTSLNTTKPTIRIAGEDKPAMVVIGKLMKLTNSGIMYALDKYREQTERIKNPTSYMLTLLYNAEEQYNLDITNRVQHDMAHWNNKD